MKFFCVIPPLTKLDVADMGTGYFALAQFVLKHKDYAQFFKTRSERGYFTILDNGLAEGTQVDTPQLLKAIELIKPSEVIAPDVLYDCEKTISSMYDFLDVVPKEINVMGVPQGSTPEEYLDCYDSMLKQDRITTIGLSKFSVPKSFSCETGSLRVGVNRQYLIKVLKDYGALKKPLHLLGMRDPFEYTAYKGNDFVRSTDSCLPVLAGLKGILFDKEYNEELVGSTLPEFFDSVIGDSWNNNQLAYVYSNILILKNIIKSTQ